MGLNFIKDSTEGGLPIFFGNLTAIRIVQMLDQLFSFIPDGLINHIVPITGVDELEDLSRGHTASLFWIKLMELLNGEVLGLFACRSIFDDVLEGGGSSRS